MEAPDTRAPHRAASAAGPLAPTAAGQAVRALRGGVAVLALGAVLDTVVEVTRDAGFTLADALSSFGVESNLLFGVLLFVLAWAPARAGRLDGLRGATVLYLAITGLVYNALLRSAPLQVPNPVAGEILHSLAPLAALVDWVVVAPARPPGRARTVACLAFPVGWAGYALVRGAVTGFHPYPFLDPDLSGGWARVTVYLIVLATLLFLLAVAIAELGRWAGARAVTRPPDDPH